MSFATRLKSLRKEKNLTQQQLADLCFLEKSSVSQEVHYSNSD